MFFFCILCLSEDKKEEEKEKRKMNEKRKKVNVMERISRGKGENKYYHFIILNN